MCPSPPRIPTRAFWVWVRPTGYDADPLRVLRHVADIALAMAIGRGAQILLPVRPRPTAALPDSPFPEVAGLVYFPGDNSFTSDHAALAFSLAAVVWTGSRRLGAVAFLWAAAVCLPWP